MLLVEDNPTNQIVATKFLEGWGYSVTVADDGEEGVGLALDETFDVILMDLQMPNMGGLEATNLIRQFEQAERRHTPIIALTAHAMKIHKKECHEAGVDGFVAKPFTGIELKECIDKVCDGQGVQAVG